MPFKHRYGFALKQRIDPQHLTAAAAAASAVMCQENTLRKVTEAAAEAKYKKKYIRFQYSDSSFTLFE